MHGYGLPRNKAVEQPDCADIIHYGLKGSNQPSSSKARARRVWKKKARKVAKTEIILEVNNIE